MTGGLEVLPVRGIGHVTAGDDLAEMITRAAPWLRDGDVLVVTSKIVSKAEGRLVDVPADGPEREAARERVLAAETARVVARRGPTAIVQTHHGFVMAAAGIDASNVDKTHLVLLPVDPDASARALRAALAERGLRVGVIVSDTMGRAWRNGLTDVALGAAGIEPFRDHRGQIDPYGNELQLTQMAVIDELAAAGELVKGKMDQVPVAVVRGYPGAGEAETDGAVTLLRDQASDMFSLGTAEARAAGLREAATLPDAAAGGPTAMPRVAGAPTAIPDTKDAATTAIPDTKDAATSAIPDAQGAPTAIFDTETDTAASFATETDTAVRRALGVVADGISAGTSVARTGDGLRLAPPPGAGPAQWMRLGADAHRVRAALAAEGVGSTVRASDDGIVIILAR
jgi:coenzyme F420-0:L-glutamate ligase/coenzyme F420-1:gamma-L-glutamate ligase